MRASQCPRGYQVIVLSPKNIDLGQRLYIDQGGKSPSPPVLVLWSWVRVALGVRRRVEPRLDVAFS
ncbi:MAG TPA: hypothetical protein DCY27_04810, partial [Desulfobacterales bacterium]|nr:hypothetical protein [Desulfobacterales bacterium]